MRAASRPHAHDTTRLLLVDPQSDSFADRRFGDLVDLLAPGDLIVVNDAATLPASLAARLGDEPLELRLTRPPDPHLHAVVFGRGDWRTRTEDRPAPPPIHPADTLHIGDRAARVVAVRGRLVELALEDPWDPIYRYGRPVQYSYLADPLSLAHAQTPYATRPWAVEMPSAGRPLTARTLLALRRRGVAVATLTHAAGLSATGDAVLDASLPWPERYDLPAATLGAIARTHDAGGRVIAVGTTVVRALEGAARAAWRPGPGETSLVIDRDTTPLIVDGLLTTMHEPDESHYRLLLAFAPAPLLAAAHAHAERADYHAHELGDAMVVMRGSLPREPVEVRINDRVGP